MAAVLAPIQKSLATVYQMSAPEAKIVGHSYSGDVLTYEIETDKGTITVEAGQMANYPGLAKQYWKEYVEKRRPQTERQSRFGTQYRTPKRIIDVVASKERFLLCEFDGIDAPVLVRSELVRKAWPSLFIDFCEKRIAAKTNNSV